MNPNDQFSLAQKALYAKAFLGTNQFLPADPVEISGTLTTTGRVHELKAGNINSAPIIHGTEGYLLVDASGWATIKSKKQFTLYTTATSSPSEPLSVSRGAFEELAKTRANASSFLRAIDDLRHTVIIHDRELIANRLKELLVDYQEDYGQSLDAESLRTFITFMASHPELRRPILTATPEGNLFGEWKDQGRTRYVGVHFLPTRQVRYVAYRPNPLYPHQRARTSGLITADLLLKELNAYEILSWARRAL